MRWLTLLLFLNMPIWSQWVGFNAGAHQLEGEIQPHIGAEVYVLNLGPGTLGITLESSISDIETADSLDMGVSFFQLGWTPRLDLDFGGLSLGFPLGVGVALVSYYDPNSRKDETESQGDNGLALSGGLELEKRFSKTIALGLIGQWRQVIGLEDKLTQDNGPSGLAVKLAIRYSPR